MLIAMSYILVGLIFGLAFALRGYAVIEPAAKGAPIRFRLLLIPANLVLWPYLLYRWVKSS